MHREKEIIYLPYPRTRSNIGTAFLLSTSVRSIVMATKINIVDN